MLNKILRIGFLYVLLGVICIYGRPSKYVITGGPGVGKTTLLEALGDPCVAQALHVQRVATVKESATMIIKQALAQELPNPACSGGPVAIGQFQEDVWKNQLRLEAEVEQAQYAFLDRSVVDGLAYCEFYHTLIHPMLVPTIQTHRYDLVFVLAPLEHTVNTVVRTEGHETALRLHQMICEKYEQFGYTLITVPAYSCHSVEQSVALRVEFVIKKVKEYEAQCQRDGISFLN